MRPTPSHLFRAAALGASLTALVACSPPAQDAQPKGQAAVLKPQPTISGYAPAAEGLRVYYEVHGQGDPIGRAA